MNGELMRTFREEEIRATLDRMHLTKALGPDDISHIFFQKYWDVVGQSIVSCVSQILNTGVMPPRLNETYICLIPKLSCPQRSLNSAQSVCAMLYIRLCPKYLQTD